MTQIFNPDIGDLGSAAAPVSPVADQSGVMAAEARVKQKQDTAQDFANFTQGVYTLAPVVNEIAAQKYIEKNLQGEFGGAEVREAGFKTEKVAQDKFDAVTGEMEIQRRFASEDLRTLSGVEEARKQGLIGHSEAMLRARQIRARAVDRAPLWAKQIDTAFRATVGTGTGTGDILTSPWQPTPEEQAMTAERKKTAEYAAQYNVDLPTADRMRAEDAWYARATTMQPKTDNDFAAWGNATISALRNDVQKIILTQANENGTFDEKVLPKLKQNIIVWESFAREQVQKKLAGLREQGIIPSKDTINRMYDQISKEVTRLESYVSDQDAVMFLKNVAAGKEAAVRDYLYTSMPGTMAMKAAGYDPTKFLELMLTNGDQMRIFAAQNPEVERAMGMMTDEAIGAKIYGDVVKVASSDPNTYVPTNSELASVTNAMSVGGPGDRQALVDFSKENGTFDSILNAYRKDPQAIVSLANNDYFSKWSLEPADVDSIFKSTGAGINTAIMEAVTVGKDPEVILDFDTDGTPIVTGEGASPFVVGLIQDTYSTILGNENTWKQYADSPEEYLRQILPRSVKVPISQEMAGDLNALKSANDPQNVLNVVSSNMSQYLSSEETVDEVSRVLLDNARIAQKAQMSSLAKQLKQLEDELWNTYLGEVDAEN